ncbi:MAG: class I SAM-dependent methyltransferase [Proteobacteria bacterium]|nr:class I SAM-dependent methyltransferase [Pseudomonadota bacterium]MDA1301384.1 class I SAM-dependent methyltransferase [Pseudomonadota bacterium]
MSRYRLERSATGLRLADGFSRQHPLEIDFGAPSFAHRLERGGGRREQLARAASARPGQRLIDCTAGLGRDGFLMASLGCEVTMIERSTVVAQLLFDALLRAKSHPELAETAQRITLLTGDARCILPALPVPDVIIVDPMFPARRKRAMVKGEMQLLQRFLGTDEDAAVLVQTAINTGCPRVVLKRPLHSGDDRLPPPSYSLRGTAVRYDVYVGGPG